VQDGASPEVVVLERVSVARTFDGVRHVLLDDVGLEVLAGQHWAIAGPNGAGKTTLARVLAAQMFPSSGVVTLLGRRLGRVPVEELRRRVGVVDPGFGRRFYLSQRSIEVVLSGIAGTILLVEDPSPAAVDRARDALELVDAGHLAGRQFWKCSEGERARILLARSLVTDAPLLVLDEPTAGLDVVGRELFLAALEKTVSNRPGVTTITVTHSFEELPRWTSHMLLLRKGQLVAAGDLASTLVDEKLTECFGVPLRVRTVDGRSLVSLQTA
jgi:iron complex transport system ATP-binding protein